MNSTISKSKLIDHTDGAKGKIPLSQALELCRRKIYGNIKSLADKPTTWAFDIDGDYSKWQEDFYEIGNWTSSFFTGMALLAWRETEDEYFLNQVLRLQPHYRNKVFKSHHDTHHDLGFLYSLYSVALFKLTGHQEHRETGVRAAEVLAERFNPKGNFIRAWGHVDGSEFEDMAIIDCMMNLPLLYWASQVTGNKNFYEIAVRHADTTLKYFIRPDDTLFHAYRFDLETGQPRGGENYCGYSVESHWARGTAWAIYGFALSYRYAGDQKYLDASVRLARKFNQLVNGDTIPVWDFRLPAGQKPLLDSSAAAVAACGFQELATLGVADARLVKAKESLLFHLCSSRFLNSDEDCRGVLRDGQVGGDGVGTARNAYTSWGDYFLMEALDRQLHGNETWW